MYCTVRLDRPAYCFALISRCTCIGASFDSLSFPVRESSAAESNCFLQALGRCYLDQSVTTRAVSPRRISTTCVHAAHIPTRRGCHTTLSFDPS